MWRREEGIWAACLGTRNRGGEEPEGQEEKCGIGTREEYEGPQCSRVGQQVVPEGYGMSTPVIELGCGKICSVCQ